MRSFRDCLPGILKTTVDRPDVVLVLIRELWPQIAGEELARNSEPIQLSGRTLTLAVDDAVWKTQLQELRPLIIRAINEQWGCRLIERIRINLRPR